MNTKARFSLLTSLFVGAIAWVGLGCGGSGTSPNAQPNASASRMAKLVSGMLLYTNDYDGTLPLADSWYQGTYPYVLSDDTYHSPLYSGSSYGYALNAEVAGGHLSSYADRANTIGLFDSTDLRKNATATTDTLPSPVRYSEGNTIAYLDGHIVPANTYPGTDASDYAVSRNRLQKIGVGMSLYASDFDDRLPLANQWVDQLYPYVGTDQTFRSPRVEWLGYGYALDSTLAGVQTTTLTSPSTAELVFDSTDLTKNATHGPSTKPIPARYGANNTVLYVDGHVAP